jgi:excisionase family DNA binding protein
MDSRFLNARTKATVATTTANRDAGQPLPGRADLAVRQYDEEILTADEVAGLLRLDRKTVYEAARSGSLPCLRLGKILRFSRQAVLETLMQGRVAPAKEGA